jgi:hypothetical protein
MMTVAELVGTLPQVVSARPEVAAGADDVRDPFNPHGRGDARAELLAVRGTGVTDVIANAPADRIVIHDGVVVSRSETRTWMAV